MRLVQILTAIIVGSVTRLFEKTCPKISKMSKKHLKGIWAQLGVFYLLGDFGKLGHIFQEQ